MCRCIARCRCYGYQHCRARGRFLLPSGSLRPRRYHEPGRGRYSSAAAGPLWPERVVVGEHDPLERVEVIKRRLAYEQDADTFIAGYQDAQAELAAKITAASELLPQVTIDDSLLTTVAKLSVELGVDGHRADITVIKTALTVAAFNGRTEVTLEDIKQAAKLVLPHRMRRRPFEEGALDWDKVESFLSHEG